MLPKLAARLGKDGGSTELEFRLYIGPKSAGVFGERPEYERYDAVMEVDLTPVCPCTIPGATLMATGLLWGLRQVLSSRYTISRTPWYRPQLDLPALGPELSALRYFRSARRRQARARTVYKRDAIVGHDNVHGYKEMPQVPFMEGAVAKTA